MTFAAMPLRFRIACSAMHTLQEVPALRMSCVCPGRADVPTMTADFAQFTMIGSYIASPPQYLVLITDCSVLAYSMAHFP
jgi:hypothetical protein